MTARSGFYGLLGFAFLLALVSPADAGHPHDRNGFYLGFGFGAGGDQENYVGGGEDSGGGLTGNLRLGGAFNRTIALGFESAGFTREDEIEAFDAKLRRTASVAVAAVTWFPVQGGAFLRGGIGFARVSAEYRPTGGVTVEGNEGGLGLLLAGGYEWRLTRKFALAPQLQWAVAGIDGDVVENVSWWALTAQFNWWW